MITEFFINIIFGIVSGFFSLMPNISWDVNSGVMDYFLDVVGCAMYFLPMNTILQIGGLVVAFTIFKIVVSFIRTLWEMLPMV